MVPTDGRGYFVLSQPDGFSVSKIFPHVGPWGKAVLVDLKEVGYQDVISVTERDHKARVIIGGIYDPVLSQEWEMVWTPVSLVVADFDGNESADFAVVTYGYPDYPLYAHGVHVFMNNGSDMFASPMRYVDSTWTGGQFGRPFLYGICALDADNDGKVDLATTSTLLSTVAVWRGRGDGTFEQPISRATGSFPYAVTAADLDNDGDSDLAVANYNSASVSILINNTR
jgi:hypothetical protein